MDAKAQSQMRWLFCFMGFVVGAATALIVVMILKPNPPEAPRSMVRFPVPAYVPGHSSTRRSMPYVPEIQLWQVDVDTRETPHILYPENRDLLELVRISPGVWRANPLGTGETIVNIVSLDGDRWMMRALVCTLDDP